MTIAIWTWSPDLAWTKSPIRPAEHVAFAPGGAEQRADLQPRTRWEYGLEVSDDKSVAQAIEAFLEARSWTVVAFFFREPLNGRYSRTGVSCGTGDGVETTFSLPSLPADLEGGDYPIDDANFVGYVDGSPATVSSVDTEARTFTFAAAPANTKPVTADYWFYRLVRLLDRFQFEAIGPDFYHAAFRFLEVPA